MTRDQWRWNCLFPENEVGIWGNKILTRTGSNRCQRTAASLQRRSQSTTPVRALSDAIPELGSDFDTVSGGVARTVLHQEHHCIANASVIVLQTSYTAVGTALVDSGSCGDGTAETVMPGR